MTTRHTLQPKYDELCADMDVEIHNVERLFCDLLNIPDCEWGDLVRELDNMHLEEDDLAMEDVTQIYECLMTFTQKMASSELEELR